MAPLPVGLQRCSAVDARPHRVPVVRTSIELYEGDTRMGMGFVTGFPSAGGLFWGYGYTYLGQVGERHLFFSGPAIVMHCEDHSGLYEGFLSSTPGPMHLSLQHAILF